VTWGPKLAFVTLELDESVRWQILHLASKYTQGCLVEFIEGLIRDALIYDFKEELEKDIEAIKKQNEGSKP